MKPLKAITYMEWLSLCIGGLGFIFVVFPKLTTLGIILLLGTIVTGYVKGILKFQWSKVASLITLLYLAYLISTFWTTNGALAGKYLEYKLSFVIFPILFSFKSKQALSPSPIIWGWFIGVNLALILGLYSGWVGYQQTGNLHSFMSTSISRIHHPTYFTAFSTLLLGLLWWANSQDIRGFHKKWIIPYTLFSLVHHFMLMSMAGVLFVFVVLVVVTFILIYKYLGKYALIGSIVLMPMVCFYLSKKINVVQAQVHGISYFLDEYTEDPVRFVLARKDAMSGNEIRLVLWTVASIEFMEHPFGVGLGSMEERMDKRLRSYGRDTLAEEGMNPHNQYLQVGIELGVIGLLLFFTLLGYLCYFAVKNRNYVLLLLTTSLMFNSLFESMLQRQSGIVFYTFWIFLIIHLVRDHKKMKLSA